MSTGNLFEELLNKGLEETMRKQRKFFIEEIKNKVLELAEAEVDAKTIIKDLTDYLNETELRLTLAGRY